MYKHCQIYTVGEREDAQAEGLTLISIKTTLCQSSGNREPIHSLQDVQLNLYKNSNGLTIFPQAQQVKYTHFFYNKPVYEKLGLQKLKY